MASLLLNVAVGLLCIVWPAHISSQQLPLSDIEVKILPRNLVQPGETVTFTCVLRGVGSSSPEPTLNVMKGVLSVMGVPYTEFLSQNDNLKRPYNMLPRFQVITDRQGDDYVLTLTITEVKKEDTGDYACSTVGLNDLYAVTNLHVYNPPEPVVLFYNGTVLTENIITLMAEEDIPLTCRSSGGVPEPAMYIYVKPHETVTPHHDHAVKHRDINEFFLISTDKNIRCKENPAEKDCPLHVDYDIIGEARGLKAQSTDDGQQITCEVVMRVYTNDSQSRSVGLNILYKPTIKCGKLQSVRANTTNVKISCDVASNPAVDIQHRQWTLGPCDKDPEAILGMQSAEYRTDQMSTSHDNKVFTFELTITRVTKRDFGKQYCIRAWNDYGQTTEQFTLKELYAAAGMKLSPSSPAALFFSLALMYMTSKFF